jgi:uncharacterized protein YecE (DUF72 family)
LPQDDSGSVHFLNSRKNSDGLKIFFGAPAWGHIEWVGKIYPAGTRSAEYLFHYSRFFTCIELNTSHYRIPRVEQARLWREQVPSHFLFCPKVFQGLSHARHGLLDQKLLGQWFQFLEALAENCGPCFLQLPPGFGYSSKADLFAFLKAWPNSFDLALEFRHPSWFADKKILPALSDYLQSRGIGLVITDVAGRRDVLHSTISADFSIVRFVGNNLHASDYERAQVWTHRFIKWQNQGLKKLFLFIHEPDDISVPEMADFFLEQFQEKAGWKRPKRSDPVQKETQLLMKIDES